MCIYEAPCRDKGSGSAPAGRLSARCGAGKRWSSWAIVSVCLVLDSGFRAGFGLAHGQAVTVEVEGAKCRARYIQKPVTASFGTLLAKR